MRSAGGSATTNGLAARIGIVSGAQGLTMAAQLAYLTVASRIVPPPEFAIFAIGGLVATFGVMLAQTSLGRASARRLGTDINGDRSLVTSASLLGAALLSIIVASASLIARLWNLADATVVIIIMSVQIPLASVSSVQAGILRRLGRIREYSICQVAGSIFGVTTGAIAIVLSPSATSLAVQPLAAALAVAIAYALVLGKRSTPGRIHRAALSDLRFSLRAGAGSLLIYVFASLPLWAMSALLGPTTFANWNRAQTVGQVPVDLVSRSVATVVYPTFRTHAAQDKSTQRIWTTMLNASALILLPCLAVTLPAVGPLVTMTIGPEWLEARSMAPWIVATSVVSLHGSLLLNALESSAHFRVLISGYLAAIIPFVVGTLLVMTEHQWIPAAMAFLAAAILLHATQAIGASRVGLLNGRVLARSYLIALAIAVPVCLEAFAITFFLGGVASIVNAGMLSSAYILFAYRNRQFFTTNRIFSAT